MDFTLPVALQQSMHLSMHFALPVVNSCKFAISLSMMHSTCVGEGRESMWTRVGEMGWENKIFIGMHS
jgi:hypothetical protein